MRKNIKIMFGIILLTVIFCVCFGSLKFMFTDKNERYIDHIVNKDADSTIGITEIPEDRIVDASFTSHLPLIIIDTQGQEIINYKRYNSESGSFDVPEGIDPYCPITLSVIDNADHINKLSDPVSTLSLGKIKVRGNNSSSSQLPKFQYSIKLVDEEGNNQKVSLLGFGEESSWIINPTIRDSSYIRNYLTYNLIGMIEPFQPDVRYCEVIFKNGNSYEYSGLYMLYEPVRVSENRVNISKNESKYNLGLGFLLRKDRLDKSRITLNTWATEMGYYEFIGNGGSVNKSYFTLEYPKNENVNQQVIDDITNYMSEVEKILYSENQNVLVTIDQYIDLQSFADYFIFNEFFGSYDAGMHSTYLYKSPSGKLKMGPYWDFDGAMDNSTNEMGEMDILVIQYYPWFENLLQLDSFVKLIDERYHELRKTVLNEDYIYNFIDEAQDYLGNAILRDRSVYGFYYNDLKRVEEKDTNIVIDRRRFDVEGETQRVKDYIHIHGKAMDKHIEDFKLNISFYGNSSNYNNLLAFGFIIVVLICSVLAQRYRHLK